MDVGFLRRLAARLRTDSAVVSSPAGAQTTDDVIGYWTPERQRAARPMEKELPASSDGPGPQEARGPR